MRNRMELSTEWKQVQVRDELNPEFACERGKTKGFVKMLNPKRWVACIIGDRLYLTKHFLQYNEAQVWADQQMKNVTIQ